MKCSKYRDRLQKYKFIDDSYWKSGEINTSAARAVEKFLNVSFESWTQAPPRSHVFSMSFCMQMLIVVVI